MDRITRNRASAILLDDCPFTRRALSTAIETSFPDLEVLCASSIAEAQHLAAEIAPCLFLIDSHLREGDGIDFLADMRMAHSKAHFILLADGPVPESSYPWLAETHILRKAVDRAQMLEMIRELLVGETIAPARPQIPGWKKLMSIRLTDIPADDLVYFQIESRATTVLEFVSGDQRGQVIFIHGKAMYAEVGDLEGKEALEQIMSWKSGFAFQVEPPLDKEPAGAPAAPAPFSDGQRSGHGIETRRGVFDWLNKTAASLARAIRPRRSPPGILTEGV